MENFKRYALDRLKEPSTWAGLSAVGLLLGLPPGTVDAVHQLVAAIFGVAAVLAPDRQ